MKKFNGFLKNFLIVFLVMIFTFISASETGLAVEGSYLEGLKVELASKDIYVGNKIDLKTYGVYKERTIELKDDVKYESSNTKVFTIEDKKLVAASTGMATLTASYKDKIVTKLVVVQDLKASKSKLDNGNLQVNLNWKRESNSIELQWDKVEALKFYTISRRAVGEENYKTIVEKAEGNLFLDKDIAADKEYEYKVALIDENGAKYPLNNLKVPLNQEKKKEVPKVELLKQQNVNTNEQKKSDAITDKTNEVKLNNEEYNKLLQRLKEQSEQEFEKNSFKAVSKDLYGVEDLIVINKDNTEVINRELTLSYYYDNDRKIDENKLTIYAMDDKGLLTEQENVKLAVSAKKISFFVKQPGIYMIRERADQQEIVTYVDDVTENKADKVNISDTSSKAEEQKQQVKEEPNLTNKEENSKQPSSTEIKKGKFEVAIAGLFSEVASLEKDKLSAYLNNLPEENGIWIPEKDRQFVLNLINYISSKKYLVNEKGYLKADERSTVDLLKSDIFSKLLDKLINNNKRIILSKDNGFVYYDDKTDTLLKSKFTTEESYKLTNEASELIILNSKVFEELESGKLSNELALKLLNQLDESSKENNAAILKEISDKKPKPKLKVVSKVPLYSTIGTPVKVQIHKGTAVYTGPDTVNYVNIGSVDTNEAVTGLGVERGWLYIEYSTPSGPERGFVPLDSVKDKEDVFSRLGNISYTGYSDGLTSDSNIYSGPGTNYVSIGAVDKGEDITVFNKTQNGYVYIECSSSLGTKRGYVQASLLIGRKKGFLGSAKVDTPIYSSPGNQGTYVSTDSVKNSEFVIVLEWNDSLYHVEYNTKAGRKSGYTDRNNIADRGSLSDIKSQQHIGISNTAQNTYTGQYSSYAALGTIGSQEKVFVNTLSKASPIVLPTISAQGVQVSQYGISGEGRSLNVYRVGNGKNAIVAVFAIHGFEDAWDSDGLELVKIAANLVSNVAGYSATNGGLDGWSVYIVPCANPDGLIEGTTNNGPGRTTIKEGIDINRDFPDGFRVLTNPRNKTGNTSLIPSEAKSLANLVSGIKSQSNEMIVVDTHGWENTTIGNSEISGYFDREFGFSHKCELNGQGYFSSWAQSIGAKAALVELPWPSSSQDIINRAFSQKVTNAFLNILKSKKVTDVMTGPISYRAHVEGIGWQNYVSEGQISGTIGQSLRVEAININRGGLPQGARIKYQVHVQDIGWMDYVYDGADAGTMGRGLRIEAMRMQLENAPAGYHIQYQVHVQDKGWMDPVMDGQLAGTTGEGKRIEAFKINLVQDLIPKINIDAPTEGQNLNSSLRVYGWSLHKGGVNQVKVYIDGNFVGNANTGGSRPDVKNAFPQYNNGENSGFDYNLDINAIKSGNHNIRIDSIGNDGSTISQNRNFIVQDLTRMNIDAPTEGQTLNSSLRVYGWSLHKGGVNQVKVYIDGNFVGNANTGGSRPDVKNAFPQYENGEKSGFDYNLDINSIKPGNHNIKIDSIGNDGSMISQSRNIIVQDLTPKINIDAPTEGQNLNGSLKVYGWSLHKGGVNQVKVYIDGNFIGNASIGGSRPDVKNAFPQYDNGEKSGFDYNLDINSINPGNHNIRIDSIGNDGSMVSQNRNFIVQDLTPKINIDAPTEGQNLNGSLKVYGWSLHKGGVKQVKVYIDGNFIGNANIGGSRPDVKNAFPQYENGEKSGFDYNLDINSINPGNHNIRIDSIGNDGSTISQNRNFTVTKVNG
ncbi:Ig-like domain-containing protein [Clostridium sp. C8-1-8]|uniref:Ig-like domain-containing protein n=1 Tax=Clostridium sp. C8-1-8 TaxID=2698831 RepID=UPI00136BE223|nr:Ig-like domain-containing protein [Clostridium sp. C8-1-8]